ncbi:hypothetical protein [Sphingomonas humi]|uniref:Uncharacterized protein n=1 Tax=Sphingomonas humi TaxID=335630 RepID=A0ABP7S3Y1_9SPHN
MLLAAASVLTCAMIPAEASARRALGANKLTFNVVLEDDTARSIAAGEVKPMPVLFEGQRAPANGWIVHNAVDPTAPELMLGRVTRGAGGLQMAWGKATRRGGDYAFAQTMQGSCRLAGEEVLK